MQSPAYPPQSTRRPSWMRWLIRLLAGVLLLVAAFFVGPRNHFGPDEAAPRAPVPTDIRELDAWLAAQEAQVPGIKPGNAKGIVWAAAPGERTTWSVVYLHGFSASRLETAPLTEHVARALGANVFYTRLTGHGLPGEAIGQATVQDWLTDAQEAIAIGRQLGDKVLVISCSTGATLATWLGTHGLDTGVTGHVFISPNFGPKDPRADWINGPWGHRIAYTILGDERQWTPASPAEANAWSTRYPTRSLFPMMALVRGVRESPLERFTAPVLVLYSPADQTVEPERTKEAFSRFNSTQKDMVTVDYSDAQGQHVLAGDIKAPKATPVMTNTIIKWAQALAKPALSATKG